MTVTYTRLKTDSDLMVVSLEAAVRTLGDPEGRIILHVPPERIATDTTFLGLLLDAWKADSFGRRFPCGIVGDHDLEGRAWFIERQGRRVGSG